MPAAQAGVAFTCTPAGWLDSLHVPAANADGDPAAARGGGRVANLEEPGIAWRKSTASSTAGCVEVAVVGGSVLIRDSGNPGGVVLRLPSASWSAFLAWICGEDSPQA